MFIEVFEDSSFMAIPKKDSEPTGSGEKLLFYVFISCFFIFMKRLFTASIRFCSSGSSMIALVTSAGIFGDVASLLSTRDRLRDSKFCSLRAFRIDLWSLIDLPDWGLICECIFSADNALSLSMKFCWSSWGSVG